MLAAVLGLGLLVRILLIHFTVGDPYDLGSMALVHAALRADPGHVYTAANAGAALPHWPYPPGFFPFIEVAGSVASRLHLAFADVLRVPAALADLGIAWLVSVHLGMKGASPRARLAGAALVAFSPAFALISSDHGQIDSVAILPAVAALVVWERAPDRRRALYLGLLLGAAACVKTVPAFLVLALLPWARSWREAATLVGATLAVPLLALAPFLVSDGHGVVTALRYHGGAGFGGLSLLLQPDLAQGWLRTGVFPLNGAVRAASDASPVLLALALASIGVFNWRVRPPIAVGASLVWLAVYVAGVNFFLNYLVWGLPFFLMTGRLVPVALLQLAWLVPLGIRYGRTPLLNPWPSWVVSYVYVPAMIALWLAAVVVLVRQVGALRRPGMRAA